LGRSELKLLFFGVSKIFAIPLIKFVSPIF
jgi:hypothetical protein